MQVTYKVFRDRSDLDTFMNTIEVGMAQRVEILGYRIPVMSTAGVVDLIKGVNAGGLGQGAQIDRRDIETYCAGQNFPPVPIQVTGKRLSDDAVFAWQGIETLMEFAGLTRTKKPAFPVPVPAGFVASAARELIKLKGLPSPLPPMWDQSIEKRYFDAVHETQLRAATLAEVAKGAFVYTPDIAEQITINDQAVTYYPLLYIVPGL